MPRHGSGGQPDYHHRDLDRKQPRGRAGGKYPNIFAVIGVHPTYVEESGEDVISPLRELAKNPRVVAIGETGLDYHSLPSVKLAKERKISQVFAKALQTSTEEQIEAEIHDGAYKSKQASLFDSNSISPGSG